MPSNYQDPDYAQQARDKQQADLNYDPYMAAVTDPFTSQTAAAGTYDSTDYAYGGSLAAQRKMQADLIATGQEAYGTLTGLAENSAANLKGAAADIGRVGSRALASGTDSANAATRLSNQAQQQGANLGQFGDSTAMDRWRVATDNLAAYTPSRNVDTAMGRLASVNAGDVGGQTLDTYDALRQYATQGPGPSAAEAQLAQAQDANVAAQVAVARSGRGAGASAEAMRQAQFQAADIGQRTAGELSTLRANEAATWRQQQLQALSGAGSLAGTAEQQRQGNVGLGLQAAQTYGTYAQGVDQQRLAALESAAGQYGSQYGGTTSAQAATTQARQGYLSQAQAGQQAAAGQQSNAFDQYLGASTSSAGVLQSAQQNQLAGYQAGLASEASYNNTAVGLGESEAARRGTLANSKLSADTQASLGNQRADAENDSSLTGMLGAAAGALFMSDRREKNSIRRYCATTGK